MRHQLAVGFSHLTPESTPQRKNAAIPVYLFWAFSGVYWHLADEFDHEARCLLLTQSGKLFQKTDRLSVREKGVPSVRRAQGILVTWRA